MGAVFRARHELMDKQVALKWLKPRIGDEGASRHRFMLEARAAARIRHPNVVDVYDVGEQDGALFMVMELLEGETLGLFLERSGTPLSEIIRHLIAAMRGVAAAHAVGITHRDIKPENVFIAYDGVHVDGVAKVLDFGISKLQDGASLQLTMPGVALGTPQFMSFEQLCGHDDIDRRADVYAFGVLLYLAFTGELPYDGDSMPAIIVQACAGIARRPSELRPSLSRELDRIVMKAMARRREDRYPTLELLIEALQGARVPRNSQSYPTVPAGRTVALSTPRALTRTQREVVMRPLPSERPARGRSLPGPIAGVLGAAVGLALSYGLYNLALDEPASSTRAPLPAASAPAPVAPISVVDAGRPSLPQAAPPTPVTPTARAVVAAPVRAAVAPAVVPSAPVRAAPVQRSAAARVAPVVVPSQEPEPSAPVLTQPVQPAAPPVRVFGTTNGRPHRSGKLGRDDF